MKRFVLQKPRWQHLLLLLVGLTFAFNASSAEEECKYSLQVWNTSDDVPVGTFSFSEFQPIVTFDEGQLIVTTQFLDVYLYDLNDVRKLTYLYDDGSGINDVMAEKALMKFNGTDVVFTALEKGTDIMVYAANGMLMMKKNVADAGDYTLPLSDLNQGVYLINVNGKTLKIVKK
jgi:Tol biopolymer transport system component